MKTEWLQIRDEIVASKLVFPWAFVLGTPFVVWFSILINFREAEIIGIGTVAAVNIAAMAITFGWYLGIGGIRNKLGLSKNLGFLIAVLFGVSVGVVKAIFTEQFMVFAGSDSSSGSELAQKIILGSTLSLMAVLGIGLLDSRRNAFQLRRDALVAKVVEEKLADAKSTSSDQEISVIAQELDKIRLLVVAGEQVRANQELITFSDRFVRPASHALWRYEASKFTNYSTMELIRYALLNFPFNPLRVAIAMFMGIAIFNAVTEPIGDALLRAVISFTVVFVIYSLAGLVRIKNLFGISVFIALVMLATSASSTLLGLLMLGNNALPNLILGSTLNLLWLASFTLITAGLRALVENRHLVEAEFSTISAGSRADRSVTESLGKIGARDMANHLHSSVQNKLLATAIRIQKEKLDDAQLLRELDLIEAVLVQSPETENPAPDNDFDAHVEALIAQWRGFVEIKFETSCADAGDKRHMQVLEEAVSNSVRHGFAKKISISMICSEDFAEITVTDDGLGVRTGTRGKGSDLFNSVSQGNWSLIPSPTGGSVLVISIPRH